MEEKRKYPRTEVEEHAYVSSGGSVMRCVVRNISQEGAAIDVENPAFVPQRFAWSWPRIPRLSTNAASPGSRKTDWA